MPSKNVTFYKKRKSHQDLFKQRKQKFTKLTWAKNNLLLSLKNLKAETGAESKYFYENFQTPLASPLFLHKLHHCQ